MPIAEEDGYCKIVQLGKNGEIIDATSVEIK